MKTLTSVICALLVTSVPALAEENACPAETAALNGIKAKYDGAYDGYKKEGDDLKNEASTYVDGKIGWADTEMVFDTPTVTVKDQKLIFGVPQVTMKRQDMIFGTPSSRMVPQKVGQYPETFCEDTWIKVGPLKTKGVPKCTVRWSDIITNVPEFFMQEQKIAMDVPEFKWEDTEVIMGVPEFSMQRQRWVMGLPQFTVTGFAINAQKIEDQAQGIRSRAADTVEAQKRDTVSAVHSMFSCHRQSLQQKKGAVEAQFATSIAQVDAMAQAMASQGATQIKRADGTVVSFVETKAELLEKRKQAIDNFEAALASLDKAEQETILKLLPVA